MNKPKKNARRKTPEKTLRDAELMLIKLHALFEKVLFVLCLRHTPIVGSGEEENRNGMVLVSQKAWYEARTAAYELRRLMIG